MSTTKIVTIRVRTVGQSFGCIGQLVARNGRLVAETDVTPYGMRTVAYERAESLAAARGYTVRVSP